MMARVYLALSLMVVLCASLAHAQPAPSTSAAVDLPLPELPKLEPIETPAADGAAIQSLRTRLDELINTPIEAPLHELDARLLTADLEPALVPAMAQRIEELRESLDGQKAERLLEKAREAGRKAIRAHAKEHKLKKGEEPEGDWLVFIMSLGDSGGDTWRESVELYAMLRMLEAIGTTPAVRVMIASYSYFGELVRIDLQRSFERLKDKAVPALIEAREHDARKVRSWASRQLDALGKAIPGEAVSTTDPEVLADVLRAFGRVRDVDATRVVLSFANSERVQLRRAAREAVAHIGKPAWGHYKDIYKNLTGENPPRDWDWERTLRELFRMHDSARLAKVYDTWRQGKAALDDERYQDAVGAFDQVLARAPMFEHRAAMAPAYLALGRKLADDDKRDEAQIALRKALRLDPSSSDKNAIESQLATLEAEALIEAGTPDRHLLERALELDPSNERAKTLLASLSEEKETRTTQYKRYLFAGGIGLVAILLLIWLWRPRSSLPPSAGGRAGEGGKDAARSHSEA